MKAVLDTCVLYPTVQRQMLLGAAEAGFFAPLWSAEILGEWTHTAEKRHGPEARLEVEAEAARMAALWPRGLIAPSPGLARRLWLPDAADVHVLAAAVAGHGDLIVTQNARDFPRHILAEEGLSRADPDALLLGFFEAAPDRMGPVAEAVLERARSAMGSEWTLRRVMKKARLPRLGKALEAQAEKGGW